MATLDNKDIVRSFFEKAFVEHDVDGACEMISEDYKLHDPMRPDFPGGREAFKQIHRVYLRGSKDRTCTIDDQISEGDLVATRWTVRGCQKNTQVDLPSKDECYTVSGITMSRVFDGKITEEWQDWDALGLVRPLGRL